MPYYMSPVESVLEADSNYDLYANMPVGSNGDTYGDPTQDIGDIYGEENWAFYTWDSSLNGGFDTSDTPVSFAASSNGNETLGVDDHQIAYGSSAIGTIDSVVLEAAVQIPGEAKWSNICVEFWKSGSLVETVSPFAGPDAVGTTSSPVAEQKMTVTPSRTDCDKVVATGTMRLNSPGNEYPASASMFCNIFVTASHGQPELPGIGVALSA